MTTLSVKKFYCFDFLFIVKYQFITIQIFSLDTLYIEVSWVVEFDVKIAKFELADMYETPY